MPGDIITSVQGTKAGSLAELDGISRKLDAGGTLRLEVLRWGQLMTVTMPAVPASVPVPAAQQPVVPMVPGAMPVPTGLIPAQPAAWPGPAGPGYAASYYCPQHRQLLGAGQVHPHYRCPVCYGPLSQAQ
jgi:hypothetical protein